MNHNFRCNVSLTFLIIFIISLSSLTSARFFHTKPADEKMMKLYDEAINISGNSPIDLEELSSFNELMGTEECKNVDEECVKRRVLADAHLDYIYTQRHKP
ncbi:uncharacterized protein [Rutidosis leptorrhynchoides]|uniref:uncharacterized protein n=1 Tax=Rutidosis leptorrhynchoides TaxID=125765 RepID=UPI003A996A9F